MMNDIEQVAKDLESFNNAIGEDVATIMRRAAEGLAKDLIHLRYFGVIVTGTAVNKQLRHANRRVNLGRRKHVSVKRPSPSLSRKQVKSIAAQARMNCIFEQVYNE